MKKNQNSRSGGRGAGRRAVARGDKARAKPGRKKRVACGRRMISPRKCFKIAGSGARGVGFGVVAAVVEGFDKTWDVAEVVEDRTVGCGRGVASTAAVGRALRSLVSKGRVGKSAAMLAALAHPVRLGILVKLLQGPASYRALQECTGVKAGPLYHHVNQLRLGSLVMPKRRDLYAMTRGGRNALLVSLVLPSLVKDRRARPAVGG
ncbi:MAG: winged helix-turn-helix domain-containing protein [Phycisphaerae bacterium]